MVAIAVGSALLLGAAWLHPVGDYSAESDFYGGYVDAARLIQSGHVDFARYRVVGPVYDMLLAVVAWLTRDFFTAARLIAVASAVGTWMLWLRIVRARFGDTAALWTTVFFVANPVFFRYGYAAVSHETAVLAESASLALLLGASRGRRLFLAGLAAGVASLLRYPGIVLLPAAWLILLVIERSRWRTAARAAGLHLAGFLIVMAPWVGLSMQHGYVPGEVLVRRAGFYLSPAGSGNVQDAPGAFAAPETGEGVEPLGTVVARDPGAMLQRTIKGAGDHLLLDARELVGWPVALLALLGIALAWWDRSWRQLLAIGAPWLLHFVLLAPVFYNPLYALPLLPFYLTLAGVAVGSGRLALVMRGVALKPVLAFVPLAFSAQSAFAGARIEHRKLPIEVIAAGHVLAAEAKTGERVLARKGHIGYYGGLPVVAFPRVETLDALAKYCRANGVGWVYYSWNEGILRQEFWYLLDETAQIPGLRPLYRTRDLPSVLFQVGPDFGHAPEWWNDERERAVHVALGAVQVLNDDSAWPHHLVLAQEALTRRDAAAMLAHADAAIRGRPGEALAWALRGGALHAMGRTAQARVAYETALRLRPDLTMAERGLRMLR